MVDENFISLLLIIVSLFLDYISGHIFSIYQYIIYTFSISRYGVISRKSSVLIIGGYCDGFPSSLIAKYTIDKWERVGNLQNSRAIHRAIANEDRIYVVGGSGTL